MGKGLYYTQAGKGLYYTLVAITVGGLFLAACSPINGQISTPYATNTIPAITYITNTPFQPTNTPFQPTNTPFQPTNTPFQQETPKPPRTPTPTPFTLEDLLKILWESGCNTQNLTNDRFYICNGSVINLLNLPPGSRLELYPWNISDEYSGKEPYAIGEGGSPDPLKPNTPATHVVFYYNGMVYEINLYFPDLAAPKIPRFRSDTPDKDNGGSNPIDTLPPTQEPTIPPPPPPPTIGPGT